MGTSLQTVFYTNMAFYKVALLCLLATSAFAAPNKNKKLTQKQKINQLEKQVKKLGTKVNSKYLAANGVNLNFANLGKSADKVINFLGQKAAEKAGSNQNAQTAKDEAEARSKLSLGENVGDLKSLVDTKIGAIENKDLKSLAGSLFGSFKNYIDNQKVVDLNENTEKGATKVATDLQKKAKNYVKRKVLSAIF